MSSRFAVSTQLLVFIGSQPEQTHRSEDLAKKVKTNPAFVRRLIQMLTKAKLVVTKLGKGGGTMLARDAHEISLADIYRAVEDGPLLAMPRSEIDDATEVGKALSQMVRHTIDTAEQAFEHSLSNVTVGDLIDAGQKIWGDDP